MGKVTPRLVDELIEQANRMEMPPSEGLTLRKFMILACPACKQQGVVGAMKCPRCQNPFAPVTADGVRHPMCSDCGKLEASSEGNQAGAAGESP